MDYDEDFTNVGGQLASCGCDSCREVRKCVKEKRLWLKENSAGPGSVVVVLPLEMWQISDERMSLGRRAEYLSHSGLKVGCTYVLNSSVENTQDGVSRTVTLTTFDRIIFEMLGVVGSIHLPRLPK